MRLGLGGHEPLKILRICLALIKGFFSVKRKTSWILALMVQFGLFGFVT